MHADELRQAVTKIVDLLRRSELRSVLDRYRSARGDERTVAAARLGHAGAMIMDRMQALTPAERRVARLLSLDELGTTEYWQSLLGGAADARAHQGDIVRLASRVMFAIGQLPAMVALLEPVREGLTGNRFPLADGEGRLVLRLADAGEKASDPDRVARSIDGVDMLYSACASIGRKPAMDLRLDGIDGTAHRDLHFTGERDSLSAVIAVIESIPAALADIDPDGDIDLEAVVGSLPVFDDLVKLASLGSFSSRDLKDISETMHQGALLVLESGVILVDESTTANATGRSRQALSRAVRPAAAPPVGVDDPADRGPAVSAADEPSDATSGTAAIATGDVPALPEPDTASGAEGGADDEAVALDDGDEHYERYLREREAMQRPASNGAVDRSAEQRRDAVEELLRSLDQSRNGS